MDAVREAGVAVREDAAVGEVFLVDDVKGVDGGGAGEVGRELLRARVGDVGGLEVRGKLEAVGLDEAVGHDGHDARQGREAVDHLRDRGRGAEGLEEAARQGPDAPYLSAMDGWMDGWMNERMTRGYRKWSKRSKASKQRNESEEGVISPQKEGMYARQRR